MTNPFKGAHYFFLGLRMLGQPGIRAFVIIPFLLNLTIFSILMYIAAGYFNDFLDWIIGFLPAFLSWLKFLLWPIFFILSLLIFSVAFSIIANLITAPFNSILAKVVEERLTGTPLPESDLSMIAEIILGFKNTFRNIIYTIAWAIPILIISFIPVINLITPVLWLLYGAWMMSLQYLDYPMANHSMSFKNIRANLAEKRLLTLGYGGITSAATMIPIVNFLVIPTAVAGATILWVEEYLQQHDTVQTNTVIDHSNSE